MSCKPMTPENRSMLDKKFGHLFPNEEPKMKDQHEKIKGYRDLSQDEIDLMNEGKALAEQCGVFVDKLMATDGLDKRFVSIGKTDLQTGFMALIRGVAQPTTF